MTTNLLEANQTVVEAIKTKQNISFEYKGKDRTLSPWIYGVKNGKTIIIGHQHTGGRFEGVRQFSYADVSNLRISGLDFKSPTVGKSDIWDTIHAEL